MIKQYRIRKNEEFSQIIAKKNSTASSNFVLYFDKKKESYSRIGISVSKKIGNAVVRNKVKRQIRMIISQIFDFDSCEFDYIIIVRSNYLKNSYADNKNDLEKTLKKAIIK